MFGRTQNPEAEMEAALRHGEQQAIIVGVAVLYAAAAVNGADAPPEVSDDQAKSAAMAFCSMAARADMVVVQDHRRAAMLNMVTDLIDAIARAPDQPEAGKGDAASAANDKEG